MESGEDSHRCCPMRVWRMLTGISIIVSPADLGRLQALVKHLNTPQNHAWLAEIVLLTSDGVGTIEIMRRTGKSKTCVWRWQERFMEEGFNGLLRDKTRPSRIAPLGAAVVERVVAVCLPAELRDDVALLVVGLDSPAER